MKIKRYKNIFLVLLYIISGSCFADNLVSHFTMTPFEGQVKDEISGRIFPINGYFPGEATPGAKGVGLRLDGYSTYISGLININNLNNQSLTFSLWSAMETYPMMVTDAADNQYTSIAGNMNSDRGFAFTVSSQGDYAFEFFTDNGGKVICKGNGKFPKYEWVYLKAVVSVQDGAVVFYKNGEKVGTGTFRGNLNINNSQFLIGRSFEERKIGDCYLNTINGAIDDIRIYSDVVPGHGYSQPDNRASLSVSADRYINNNVHRPQFHGMPSANWSNETHGLIYYNGRYHAFFQKNGNGPYMSRLHWGHISSDDFINWREDQIAIAPSEWYDIKGTWSGCVFQDNYLTGGKPHIFYTAVDNGQASIAQATPIDEDLIGWRKNTLNPLIPCRPEGLSSDFRDCYIFTNKGEYYMIVGTSKENRGAATLHYYNKTSRTWSNTGKIFFQSNNANYSGTFWEMPVVIPMGDKWVFMATPLGSARQGVEVLYWVGNLNDDGTFAPLVDYINEPKELEIGTIGKDGYGLLSPSILQHNGKTIALGIVPDKLPLEENVRMGWAHLYSLPRELSLDENYAIVQKPYQELSKMRSSTAYTYDGNTLNGTVNMAPVSGKMVEIEASFEMATNNLVGFNLRKKDGNKIRVYYDRSRNTIGVDARSADRIVNDKGLFNGLYESVLPERRFQDINMHIFMDHSILDIFINNKWACSVRVFSKDTNANEVEVFSEGTSATVNYIRAWTLNPSGVLNNVSDIQTNDTYIYSLGNTVFYRNVPNGSTAFFYEPNGRLIGSRLIVEKSGSFPLSLGKGFFLIKITNGLTVYNQKIYLIS